MTCRSKIIGQTYPLQQTGLLAKVGDPRMVEVGENLVDEDSICNLGGIAKIHLEQTSLQMSLLWFVVLERL